MPFFGIFFLGQQGPSYLVSLVCGICITSFSYSLRFLSFYTQTSSLHWAHMFYFPHTSSCVEKFNLRILEDTACYAGLLLAPTEGFGSTPHSGGSPHPLRSMGKHSAKVNQAFGPARSFSIVNPSGRQLKARDRKSTL